MAVTPLTFRFFLRRKKRSVALRPMVVPTPDKNKSCMYTEASHLRVDWSDVCRDISDNLELSRDDAAFAVD